MILFHQIGQLETFHPKTLCLSANNQLNVYEYFLYLALQNRYYKNQFQIPHHQSVKNLKSVINLKVLQNFYCLNQVILPYFIYPLTFIKTQEQFGEKNSQTRKMNSNNLAPDIRANRKIEHKEEIISAVIYFRCLVRYL